ncbi:hypothetical protein EYF80_040734 [Liparis tanakae]|uniref:Uncharacterized protein n=1 Tax=Liparis tanakae TaxID=230148 RepID=A0A4Z2G684_9TELE|nr:hypothetical protein EYF80_040734 [Liparis tanakae]
MQDSATEDRETDAAAARANRLPPLSYSRQPIGKPLTQNWLCTVSSLYTEVLSDRHQVEALRSI